MRDVYLAPFQAAVTQAHVGSVMPAHHPLNGVPCHANPWLLDTVLRQEWGFDGFVTSDMNDIPKLEGGHQFAVNGDRNASALALKAGVDMELSSGAPQEHVYMKELPAALRAGSITMADIDRAARRVLRAKIQLLGLSAADPQAAAPPAPANDPVLNYTGKEDIWAKLIAEGKFTTPTTAGARTIRKSSVTLRTTNSPCGPRRRPSSFSRTRTTCSRSTKRSSEKFSWSARWRLSRTRAATPAGRRTPTSTWSGG